MIDYLFRISDVYLFALLSCVSIVISVIAVYLVKRFIPFHLRSQDNNVIGNTAALISVIYGVLAGLSALYLINNNNYTADAVQREANAVADIYRDSQWLQDPAKIKIQTAIKSYLTRVIDTEWTLMKNGQHIENREGNLIIDQITNELIHYNAISNSASLLMHDMLDEIRNLYDARQQRIQMSYNALSSALWIVIIIGTILTLFINYLFGVNFYLHQITVIAAALMTSSMIFLLITLDKPFQGQFIIGPDAFQTILADIESKPKPI